MSYVSCYRSDPGRVANIDHLGTIGRLIRSNPYSPTPDEQTLPSPAKGHLGWPEACAPTQNGQKAAVPLAAATFRAGFCPHPPLLQIDRREGLSPQGVLEEPEFIQAPAVTGHCQAEMRVTSATRFWVNHESID